MTFHGGDIYSYEKQYGKKLIADFSANTSPLGLGEKAKKALLDSLSDETTLSVYPDAECSALKSAIATKYGVCEDMIACGAGATDIIFRIAQCFRAKTALIAEPAFSEYRNALEKAGIAHILSIFATENDDFELKDVPNTENIDVFFICSPSNPAGAVLSEDFLMKIAEKCEETGTELILDACFSQFDAYSQKTVHHLCAEINSGNLKNVTIINAFTKFYALAGLRAGFAICSSKKMAQKINAAGLPWAVSTPAQIAAVAALSDSDYEKRLFSLIKNERDFLLSELQKIGIKHPVGKANFLLFRARFDLKEQLLQRGFLIRSCTDYRGLGAGYFRIAVKTHSENAALINAMKAVFAEKKPCRFLMVQGTMSNAGKSFLVAALCRIFREDGLKVAPFKAQNMALNSAVGADGGEMGRAQAMQAEAAGILGDTRMNPVLLKPTGVNSSQVIVRGKAIADMTAKDFFRKKKDLLPIVLESLQNLAAENDIIVIEGAGSPAEINLKADDIVNMGLAKKISAPVILAADIDRGGVFAQLFGTVSLLDDDEKSLVKGLVINKFRGDEKLLESGIRDIEKLTQKRVLGVVPMLNVSLDDEDSLAMRLETEKNPNAPIKIAVIRLPHLSNFTDFAPFERRNDCNVRYIAEKSALESFSPHIIIIPGTKNTISDLIFLKKTGIFSVIQHFYAKNTLIIGICGGFQMLGVKIGDYNGVESETPREEYGFGFLDFETAMEKGKTLSRTEGKTPQFTDFFACIAKKQYAGYEIHSGKSTIGDNFHGIAQNFVFGTYIHGFFDSDDVTNALISALSERFSLKIAEKAESYAEWKEKQYTLLADGVRKSLDMAEIYKIAGL